MITNFAVIPDVEIIINKKRVWFEVWYDPTIPTLRFVLVKSGTRTIGQLRRHINRAFYFHMIETIAGNPLPNLSDTVTVSRLTNSRPDFDSNVYSLQLVAHGNIEIGQLIADANEGVYYTDSSFSQPVDGILTPGAPPQHQFITTFTYSCTVPGTATSALRFGDFNVGGPSIANGAINFVVDAGVTVVEVNFDGYIDGAICDRISPSTTAGEFGAFSAQPRFGSPVANPYVIHFLRQPSSSGKLVRFAVWDLATSAYVDPTSKIMSFSGTGSFIF
jgi:hypothetical protein